MPRLTLLTGAILLALVSPALAQDGGVPAPDLSDPCPPVYPGDSAQKERIARWMARGAADRGLPRELPVMAGLAESGLRNLKGPSYSGFFGMHMSLNTGVYRGFPKQPDLQLLWFLDTAALVRQRRVAEGYPDPAAEDDAFGLWVADVERPAPQNRSGYQQHLAEARRLLGGRCAPAATTDVTPLRMSARIARRQRAGIVVKLRCPDADCLAGAVAEVSAAGRTSTVRAAAVDPGGEWAVLTLRLPRHARRALARRKAVRAKVAALAADEAANPARVDRAVRVVP